MEAVKVSQMAYRLGSMETFMRMVESGKGITFIPELAVAQLTEEQRQLVRPFAIPDRRGKWCWRQIEILFVTACYVFLKEK